MFGIGVLRVLKRYWVLYFDALIILFNFIEILQP